MQQKVTDKLSLWHCYRIDKQFFVCLDDIFKKSEPNVSYLITIWCKNIKYSFQYLTEFFEYSDILVNRIVKVRFDAHFPISKSGYITNDISIMFSNEPGESTSGEITFDFYDDKSYLILKNQIETLLKNCKLDYSIFSNTAIIPFFDLTILISIIIYTIKWYCLSAIYTVYNMEYIFTVNDNFYITASEKNKKIYIPK